MECEALKEAVTSLSTHDKLLYNTELKKLKILVSKYLFTSHVINIPNPPFPKDDPLTMLKCLTIVCELLTMPKIMKLTPTLQTLMESQVSECVI